MNPERLAQHQARVDEYLSHSFISTTEIGLGIAFKIYGKRAIYTNTGGVQMAYIPTKDVNTFRELVREFTLQHLGEA